MQGVLREQGGRAATYLDQYIVRAGLTHRLGIEGLSQSFAAGAGSSHELYRTYCIPDFATRDQGRAKTWAPDQPWNICIKRRLADVAEHRREDNPPPTRYTTVSYEGPWSASVGRCKKLSLFSTFSAFAAAPIIMSLEAGGSAAASMGPKAGIAFTLCSFGAFTTGLLHWFTSPYIHRLVYQPDRPEVQVTVLSLLARPATYTIPLSEITPPNTLRPQASFQWKGKVFYIDSDHFPDGNLLRRLTPQEPGLTDPPAGTVTEPR
eukprot:jgi/Botrbrau1/14292/Bobra.0369s0006.1